MIPIALITGFLGSGKTTLLRNIDQRHENRRLAFLVNEFSAADVDGRILESCIGPVVALPGGSIFCACLVSEFIRTLEDLPGLFATEDTPLDGVVIEASGIANPKVIARMLRETGLDQVYTLATVVAVVDPGTFPILLETLPNIVQQVETCDYAIINKTDLFDPPSVDHCETGVCRINPQATVIRTAFCETVPPLFKGASRAVQMDGDYAACIDPNYARASVRLDHEIDLARLEGALKTLGDKLYRVKGFVPSQGKAWHIDFTRDGIVVNPAPEAEGPCDLVFIGPGEAAEAINLLAANLRNGGFDA